ncbi:hypothetical protein Hypma_013286 [Hypsizygus marmoreus]|uniref:CxC1-like cysteine cluster associated with KDZ transposases domain-containing protein n=1 Tax=Hypsizygus marmoreus TaxID=39966 RepID=A0A369JCH7_HYPMA|nr:hypothetical protein Hypma_013286 [Hypsizygus marmoreus]
MAFGILGGKFLSFLRVSSPIVLLRKNNKGGMPYKEDREAIEQMDLDAGHSDNDVDAVSHIVPPGDEGFGISHEGGEFEVFEDLADGLAQSIGYRRVDHRTRRDRIEIQTGHWELQMDRLVQAFLDFRLRDGGEGTPISPGNLTNVVYDIEVVDSFFRRSEAIHAFPGDLYPNETLLRHGYLGCSPLQPMLAISVRALSTYRQTHRTSPRFSIEAQCKTLCHLHNVPYFPYLSTQFSAAYDAYLEICRRVDHQINAALGYDAPNSRLLRSCPACFYKLEGEPELEFSSFVSIDGNNSLKRLGTTVRGLSERIDTRNSLSDRWLTPEEVDRFKDEVKSRPSPKQADEADDSDDWVDIDGELTGSMKCVDRWRNAGPEERKKMFALFDESGIFIASCRHRVVLLVCDMIRSGELAKYPLALINKLLDILGSKIGCAYDIGCAFATTIENSSLSPRIKEELLRLMVGAFHGHAHNRLCQLHWHPLYIPGTGHTEGEGCEHVFSSSNDLARGTRHATGFHRHQAIEEHFNFWDEDKYANLSQYLQNHYREAVAAIRTLEAELHIIQEELGIADDDFIKYFEAEKAYLQGLKEPSPVVTLKGQYVKALIDLSQCKKEWIDARAAANSVFTSVAPANIHTAIARVHRRVDSAYAKLQNAETLVGSLEESLNIEERWTEASPDYKEYYQQNVLTNYTKALDELERLVVMRLFELTKMSTSGTGYKLRRQIGKALQRRSEAIRNALARYNTQAARLDPPRPALSWKEIVDYTFLGEFDLLRHSRADIRSEPWAQPARREATVKYFKLCRAREEIVCLNVEIRRLRTSIQDEATHFETTASLLAMSNPPLCAELRRKSSLRAAINAIHIRRLDAIERQPYFTGLRGVGIRLGSSESLAVSGHQDTGCDDSLAMDGENSIAENDNDEVGDDGDRELERITEFVLTLTD